MRDHVEDGELNCPLNVEAVSDLVRRDRLRWFGHLERKSESDLESTCRNLELDGKGGVETNQRKPNPKLWESA